MSENLPGYVLDSFALIAYLKDQPGAEQVTHILDLAQTRNAILWLCLVNLAEVLYIVEREQGFEIARETVAIIDQLPLNLVEVDRKLAFAAAHVKAQHAVSLADAFAVALAKEKNARVVTGDPEFESVEKEAAIEWLPRKK